jgi:hypothetical protein
MADRALAGPNLAEFEGNSLTTHDWLVFAALIAASALSSGLLAGWCARTGAELRFMGFMIGLWICASAMTVLYWPLPSGPSPRDWPNFLTSFISLGPLIVVPMLVLIFSIRRNDPAWRIGGLAIIAAGVGFVLTFVTSIVASCWILGECL